METRITEKDKELIRSNYKPRDKNFGTKALAEKYNVCTRTIYKITKNIIWGDINE